MSAVEDYAHREEVLAAAGAQARGHSAAGWTAIVDLVTFLLVADVERSIRLYEALGFDVVKRYEPDGRLEFAGLEATPAAKVMLGRVDEVPRVAR
jgi:hypothetical protein